MLKESAEDERVVIVNTSCRFIQITAKEGSSNGDLG